MNSVSPWYIPKTLLSLYRCDGNFLRQGGESQENSRKDGAAAWISANGLLPAEIHLDAIGRETLIIRSNFIFVIDAAAKFLSGAKERNSLGGNVNHFAGAGVAAFAVVPRTDAEAAESAQIYPFPFGQGVNNAAQHGIDDDFAFPFWNVNGGGGFFNDFCFCHKCMPFLSRRQVFADRDGLSACIIRLFLILSNMCASFIRLSNRERVE